MFDLSLDGDFKAAQNVAVVELYLKKKFIFFELLKYTTILNFKNWHFSVYQTCPMIIKPSLHTKFEQKGEGSETHNDITHIILNIYSVYTN